MTKGDEDCREQLNHPEDQRLLRDVSDHSRDTSDAQCKVNQEGNERIRVGMRGPEED